MLSHNFHCFENYKPLQSDKTVLNPWYFACSSDFMKPLYNPMHIRNYTTRANLQFDGKGWKRFTYYK